MANKTTQSDDSVVDFINLLEDETKKKDSFQIVEIMKNVTGFEPKMWGTSIIGFGSYHYKYASGREDDWLMVGFSPRKAALVLYLIQDFDRKAELLTNFGKYKMGKGCIYVKKLSDIDTEVLKEMIASSVEYIRSKFPCK